MGRRLPDLVSRVRIDSKDLDRTEQRVKDLDRTLRKSGDSTRGLETGLDRVVRQNEKLRDVGGQLTRNVTLPLAAGAAAALKLNSDFATTFTQMQGLAGVAADEVAGLRDEVQDLAVEAARSPQDVAEGLYQIRSSGLEGAAALETLDRSAKAAAVGLGETEVVADAVTSALNAYGTENLSATRATDLLVGAVREGKGEPAEMAGQFGRLLPIASELGVEFEEVAGGLAFLTRSSGNAAQSSTQLSGILQKLIRPTQQGREELERHGLSVEQLRRVVRDEGLLPALQLLDERFQGNSQAMGKVFEDSEGLVGVLALLRNGGQDAAQVMEDVAGSTGALDEAFVGLQETDEFKARQALSELQVTAIAAGAELAPVLTDIAGGVSDVVGVFNALPESAQRVILILGGLAAAAGPAATAVGNVGRVVQFLRSHSDQASSAVSSLSSRIAASPTAVAGGVAAATLLVLAYQDIVGGARQAEEQVDSLVAAAESSGDSIDTVFRERLAKTLSGAAGGFSSDLGRGFAEIGWQLEEAGVSADELAESLLGTEAQYQALVDRIRGSDIDPYFHAELIGQLDLLRSHGERATTQQRDLSEAQAELGIETDTASKKIQQQGSSFWELAMGVSRAGDSTDEATPKVGRMAEEVLRLADEAGGATGRLKTLEERVGELVDLPIGRFDAESAYQASVDSVADSLADLQEARAALNRGYGEDAAAFRRAQDDAQRGVEAGERRVRDAQRRIEDLQRRLREAEPDEDTASILRDIERAQEDLTISTEDLARARGDASGVRFDDGEADRIDTVTAAEDRLAESVRAQVERAVELREAEALANGERFTAVDRNEAYRAELQKLVDMLAPEDPLRQRLQGLLTDLENINREFEARVTVGVSYGELDPPENAMELAQRALSGFFGGRPDRGGLPVRPPGFAGGGWVRGRPGTDAVLARVTRDEFVVEPGAAARHAVLLERINAGLPPPPTHLSIPAPPVELVSGRGGIVIAEGAVQVPLQVIGDPDPGTLRRLQAVARQAVREGIAEAAVEVRR